MRDQDDEWKPYEDGYSSEESEVDIDEAKIQLIQKVREIKKTLSQNSNIDILKKELKYMRNNIKLKNYQVQGVNWIVNIFKNDVNGILADDMGLGKTVQTICALTYLKQYENKNSLPFLIVVPLSIYNNWIEEINRFSKLTIFEFFGPKEKRNELKEYVMEHGIKKDIVLVTYETTFKENEFLKNFKYDCLVVDEAQRIKNKKSVLYENLGNLKFNHNLFLTGTPIQNNIGELHSLLRFQNPNIFNMKEKIFSAFFPSLSDTVELQSVMKPFILRREKEKVLKLPPINETIIYSELSELQKRLYKAILLRDISAFTNCKYSSLQNILTQLRKCVNHPYLFDDIEPEPYEMGDHLIHSSGKFVILDGLLKYLKKNNHRVLIFSQMTRTLDILQDYLDYKGYSYERLDGSIRGDDRYEAIRNFQDTKNNIFIFLLSTRAGGLGLNLTAADTVIFIDNDFNPQVDRQAAARVHRIGQTKRIQIIRLICKDSVEEAMWDHISKKLVISESIMKNGTFSEANNFKNDDQIKEQTEKAKKEFKKPEILIQILKHGLKNLLQIDNENEQEKEKENEIGNHQKESKYSKYPQYGNIRMTKEQLLNSKMEFLITDEDLDKIFHVNNAKNKSNNVENDEDSDDDDEVRINSKIPIEEQQKKKNKKTKVQIDTVSLFNFSHNTKEYILDNVRNDEDAFNELLKEKEEEKQKENLIDENILNINHKRRLRSQSQPNDEEEDEQLLSLDEIEKIARIKRMKIYYEKIDRRKKKLMKKWEENHYSSYEIRMDPLFNNSLPSTPSTVSNNDNDDNDDINEENDEKYLHYVNGDVVNPSISDIKKYCQIDSNNNYNVYIVHCVDKTGNWGSGGVFSAINNADPLIGHKYEFAGQNNDLHLGDLHLIPMESDVNNVYTENNVKRHVGLIVAYNRNKYGYLLPLLINHFENCLELLCRKAKQTNASIHFPKISDQQSWYKIERIIRKCVLPKKIQTFIYYYSKPEISEDISSPGPYTTSSPTYYDYNYFITKYRSNYGRHNDDDSSMETEEEEEEELFIEDEENDKNIRTTYSTRYQENKNKIHNDNTEDNDNDEDDDKDYNNDKNYGDDDNNNINNNIESNKSFVIDIDTPKLLSLALSRTNSISSDDDTKGMTNSIIDIFDDIDDKTLSDKFKNIGDSENNEEEITDENDLKEIRDLIQNPFPSILKGMTLYIYTNPKKAEDICYNKIKDIITRHVYAYDGQITKNITDPKITHILLINDEDQTMLSVFNPNITIISLNEFLCFISHKLNK